MGTSGHDVKSLKGRLENARRARRWALVLAAVVGFWLFAVIWHWVVTVNKG